MHMPLIHFLFMFCSIVKEIAKLAESIPVPNKTGTPVTQISSHVAIQAVSVDKTSFQGAKIGVLVSGPEFDKNSVNFNKDLSRKEVSAELSLPASLTADAGGDRLRLSFVVYKIPTFFSSGGKCANGGIVNSIIVSAKVKGREHIKLSNPLNGIFKHINKSDSSKGKCVFWNFTADGKCFV